MSFRNRLTFFFVVIVIVPMIAVAVVLFRLISDNETGKADSGVRAQTQAAAQLYRQDASSAAAADAVNRVARDPKLGAALAAGNLGAARLRVQQLVGPDGVARVALLRSGSTAFDVGDPNAIAPAPRDLISAQGASLGRLEVSVTPASAFAQQVRTITGLSVIVRSAGHVLGSTVSPLPPLSSLPPAGTDSELKLAGVRYRTVTFGATGFGGQPLQITALANYQDVSGTIGDSRILAAALVAVFFIIALAFAVLVSRSLQMQIGGFLEAARRLAGGDFSAEVPIVGHDEFAALGQEFNKMSHELEARLKELREQQTRLEGALHRVGETFASNLDRDALLEIMLRTAVDGVGAAGGRASVRGASDRFEERVRVGTLAGHEQALQEVEARVLQTGEPGDAQVNGSSAVGHPLVEETDSKRVLALLSVARDDRAFTPTELDLFHYLAGQAAVSIENVDLHERVQRQAVTDGLTGLFNHRRFQEAIATEIERARRFDQDLGLVMIDIDDFKQVNDTYGHQQGDLVLREVARIVRENSREIDAPARYGGEELAVVLPGTSLEGAYNLAERVRAGIEALALPLLDGDGQLRVTASLGVASFVPSPEAEPRDLIAAADAALYEAKHSGKNRVVRAR